MKTALILFATITSVFSSTITEISKHTQKIDEARIAQREVLSMDVDIREYKRSFIMDKRETQSARLSKMIKCRDYDRSQYL